MRKIFMFLGKAGLCGLAAFFTLCLLAVIRLKDGERYKRKSDKAGLYDV